VKTRTTTTITPQMKSPEENPHALKLLRPSKYRAVLTILSHAVKAEWQRIADEGLDGANQLTDVNEAIIAARQGGDR
jgi:hypothetical protein